PKIDRTRVTRADVVCAFHGWLKEEEGEKTKLYGGRWLIPKLRIACPWAIHHKVRGVRYLGGVQLTVQGLNHWATQHSAAEQDGRGAKGSSGKSADVNRWWAKEQQEEEEKEGKEAALKA